MMQAALRTAVWGSDFAATDFAATSTAAHRDAPPSRAGVLRGVGYERVARLGGNTGYIELRGCRGELRRFAAVTEAVIDGLQDAAALIIDLRRYQGGTRAALAVLASVLFDTQPMYLDAVYWGAGSRARPLRLVPRSTGARYVDRPVVVLTSAHTSSAGREFAAALEGLGRGLVTDG